MKTKSGTSSKRSNTCLDPPAKCPIWRTRSSPFQRKFIEQNCSCNLRFNMSFISQNSSRRRIQESPIIHIFSGLLISIIACVPCIDRLSPAHAHKLTSQQRKLFFTLTAWKLHKLEKTLLWSLTITLISKVFKNIYISHLICNQVCLHADLICSHVINYWMLIGWYRKIVSLGD